MRVFFSPVALAAALTACGSGASNQAACDTPTGCVSADRVSGTCQCLEWQVVLAEPVPLKFVVVGIAYPALGNQTQFAIGNMPPGNTPTSSSDFGTRWRSVIQMASGSQTVSTIGPSDLGPAEWKLVSVTADSAAFALPAGGGWGMGTLPSTSGVDVTTHEFDYIVIWINPAAVVITNYVGEKTVSWSWTSKCLLPEGCVGPMVFFFRAGELDGTFPPPANEQAMLAALDADDRAAILKYDPFFEPGRDPATIATDPRFRNLGSTTFGPNVISTPPPPLTWTPCSGTLTDDGFQTLSETDVPFGAGETLMLQHSVLSTSASCAPQQPGLMLGTTTPNCWITADIFVDTLFGSLLMIPTSVGSSCSGP